MLLRNAEVLSMVDGANPRRASIRIEGTRIAGVGELEPQPHEHIVDASGLHVLPGFVQGHLHLCQTLFRNLAEGLPLLEWLQRRIWPLEAAHDEASLRASARLALHELIRGGCTTFQSMETVRGTEFTFDEVHDAGLRGVLGNALMDSGDAPAGLRTGTTEALAAADELRRDWDGRDGRLHFAFNPRFILSCSDELHEAVADRRVADGARVHTHACEHPLEVEAVARVRGCRYLVALERLRLLGPETSLAHCVHLDEQEHEILRDSGAAVLHCPSTNLKLGSGLAPIAHYRSRGVPVAIGADGAPANNRLDALTEARQAGLIAQLASGPGSVTAFEVLTMLTRDGAAALGLGSECGTIETGKSADLVFFDLNDPALGPAGDVCSKIVFGADRSHVRHVMASGEFLLRDGAVEGTLGEVERLAADTRRAARDLVARSGI